MAFIVGLSFTAVTITSNVVVNEALSSVVLNNSSNPASVTVTVIVAVPDWFASGVSFRVPVVSFEA